VFALVCRYDPSRPVVIAAVESLRRHHPDAEIVVVDSDSPDKSYFEPLARLGVHVEDARNRHYEAGALWHVYDKFARDFYFFLHDTMLVTANLDHLRRHEVSGFMYWEDWNGCRPDHVSTGRRLLAASDYPFLDEGFYMVFGGMLFCRRSVLDRLRARGFHRVLPDDKVGSCAMERLFGIALHHEGLSSLIPRNFLSRWAGCEQVDGYQVTRTPLMTKVWLGRA
jgi:hypothetical protein